MPDTTIDPEITRLTTEEHGSLFDSSLELHRQLGTEIDPDQDPDTSEGFRASLRGNDKFGREAAVACVDGHAIGLLRMYINNLDHNTDKADANIEVAADHRRRGTATALLVRALDICDEANRTSLMAFGVNSAISHSFWTSFGAERRLIERESRLWVGETDADLMESWIGGRTERARDYELIKWRGSTPEAMLGNIATMRTAMNDAPIDDLDWEDDIWTEQDVRDIDKLAVGNGYERWAAIVLGPDGSPAGFTTVSTSKHKPRFAKQGDTVVLRDHRERGIGRWLKGEMWQWIRDEAPAVVAIDTENAESNDPMLAINVAMGFRPAVEWACWQADVSGLRTSLQERSAR